MVTESRSETRSFLGALLREALLSHSVVRNLLAFCGFVAAYYFAYRYGMSFSQATASPFWFPDSVLLCALLVARPRWWLLLIAATVPIRLFTEVAAGVPLGMLVSTSLNDYVKAMVAAALLRHFMDDPIRFRSLRDFGVFCLIAVLAMPALSAFAGAFSRGSGLEYWTNWEHWFLGDALAQLIVTPFIFYWVLRPWDQRNLSTAQWLEALVLLAGLIISLTLAFQPASSHLGFSDTRMYAPVAFLFWAAVRFGMRGATAATAILTFFAVAATQSGGSYSSASAAETASGLQQFLLLRAAPLYLVAVLLEHAQRIQLSLHESEHRFRDMADNAPVMTWIAGTDGRYEFVNKGWLDFTGRALSQERGDGWAQGVHADDRQRCLAIYQSSFSARCEFEVDYRLRRRDGVYRWILARGVPRYGDNGEFVGFIGSALDVTDRRRQESALRQSEERYRAVVDSQTELVCRFTRDLTLTFVNEAYCRFLGKRRDEVLGSKLSAYFPGDAREQLGRSVAHALSGAASHGEWQCEVTIPDGSRGWQHWTCQAIDGAGEMPDELQAIGHDITDRKRAEESQRRLAHTSRLAAVGELTAMVAHEVNQPLCAILSNAEAAETLLARENPPLDEIREIVRDIRDDDLRADEVIRGIRSLVGRREIQIQPVDLNRMVAHVLRLVSGDALFRRVRIQRMLDETLPLVAADQSQIEQVLLNLIVNGMDAMQATPETARELSVQTRVVDKDLVEIAVVDHGCGIPPEKLPELFDSFFTTKADGMGIGLSIARWIVLAHGGRIWAANGAQGGAEFRFTLRTALTTERET